MSTKIHDGWKLPNLNRKELKEFVKRVQKAIQKEHENLYNTRFAQVITTIMDYRYLYPEEYGDKIKELYQAEADETNYPLFLAFEALEKRIKEGKFPMYDFNCELVLFPIEDSILMQIFTVQKSFKKIITDMPEVSRYAYWDNTDRDKNCSEEEWEKRGKDWSEALGETWIPALEGYTVTCTVDSDVFPKPEDILSIMLSYDERVKRHAQSIVFTQKKEEIENEVQDKMLAQKKARDFLLSDDGKILIETEKERISKMLPVHYTKEDFMKNFEK